MFNYLLFQVKLFKFNLLYLFRLRSDLIFFKRINKETYSTVSLLLFFYYALWNSLIQYAFNCGLDALIAYAGMLINITVYSVLILYITGRRCCDIGLSFYFCIVILGLSVACSFFNMSIINNLFLASCRLNDELDTKAIFNIFTFIPYLLIASVLLSIVDTSKNHNQYGPPISNGLFLGGCQINNVFITPWWRRCLFPSRRIMDVDFLRGIRNSFKIKGRESSEKYTLLTEIIAYIVIVIYILSFTRKAMEMPMIRYLLLSISTLGVLSIFGHTIRRLNDGYYSVFWLLALALPGLSLVPLYMILFAGSWTYESLQKRIQIAGGAVKERKMT